MAAEGQRRTLKTASAPGQTTEGIFGLELEHQCESAIDEGCKRFSGKFEGSVEIPLNFSDSGRLNPPVGELSGLAHADDFTTLVAVGDAGRLYFMRRSGVRNVEFVSSLNLEIPAGDVFVDAESLSVICDDKDKASCPLDDPGTTILVGSERNAHTTARIAEYYVNGTIKDLEFVSSAVLTAVGLESENQFLNGGFEGMSTSVDHRKVIFTTEDPMPIDDEVSRRIRRLVVYDRDTNSCQIFRYDLQHDDDDAGVVDVTFIDENSQFATIMERKYIAEWNVDKVDIFYVQLKAQYAISLTFDKQGVASLSRDELSAKLHAHTPLEPHWNKPVFSFPVEGNGLTDNFEGLVLLPSKEFVLVSDNNENPNQHTYITTLFLTNKVDSVYTMAFWGLIAIIVAFSLLCICCCRKRRYLKYCRMCLGRETAYVDLGDSTEEHQFELGASGAKSNSSSSPSHHNSMAVL